VEESWEGVEEICWEGVEEIMEKEVEMAQGEGLQEERELPGDSSVFLMGMLAVTGRVWVRDAESAERGSEVRGGTRLGSEFELAFSLALRFEKRSMEGVFFRGCRTTSVVPFSTARGSEDIGVDSCSGGGVGMMGVKSGVGAGVAAGSTGKLKSGERMNCRK
jgi:hypothetical protein